MSDIVSGIKTAAILLKKLKVVGDKIKDAEFRGLVADLDLALSKTKIDLSDALDEAQRLKGENSRLQEMLDQKSEFTSRNGVYYKEGDKMPFCSRCLEVDHRMVHLSFNVAASYGGGRYECPQCKNKFA